MFSKVTSIPFISINLITLSSSNTQPLKSCKKAFKTRTVSISKFSNYTSFLLTKDNNYGPCS